MTTPASRYRESFSLLADGKWVSNVTMFINPLMRSVVFSYHLSEPCDVKIEIKSQQSGDLIRNIFLIRGNAGGRAGKNKVLWDGTAASGLKVPQGTYQIRFLSHQRQVSDAQVVQL